MARKGMLVHQEQSLLFDGFLRSTDDRYGTFRAEISIEQRQQTASLAVTSSRAVTSHSGASAIKQLPSPRLLLHQDSKRCHPAR